MKRIALVLVLLMGMLQQADAQYFSFVKNIGGAYNDHSTHTKVDRYGNIYWAGNYKGTVDLDPGLDTFSVPGNGLSSDIFLVKLTAAGDFVWGFRIAGGQLDSLRSMDVDDQGNVYLAGSYRVGADFDPGPGVYNLSTPNDACFIAKYNAYGELVWAKIHSYPANSGTVTSIGLDESANIIFTIEFFGPIGSVLGTSVGALSSNGETDLLICKADSAGNLIWSKRIGGSSFDTGQLISVKGNNISVTGKVQGTVDFDPGPAVVNSSGSSSSQRPFILSLDGLGSFKRARSLTTLNLVDIEIDAFENIYVAGHFTSTVDFDLGTGSANRTSAGSNDIFIVKMDSVYNFSWVKTIGSTGNETGMGLELDIFGNLYLYGRFTTSVVDFDPGAGVFNMTPTGGPQTGGTEIFFSKLDSAGNFISAFQLDYAVITSVAVDTLENMHIAGDVYAPVDFDPDTGVVNLGVVNPNWPYTSTKPNAFLWKVLKHPPPPVVYTLQGSVFTEFNANCSQDSIEKRLAGRLLKALPGPFYGVSNSSGNYFIAVDDTGMYTVTVATVDSFWEPVCTTSYFVHLQSASATAQDIDFAIKPDVTCARLSVDIAVPRLRACTNSTYAVSCYNTGTLPAAQAHVVIDFAPSLQVQFSSIPWSSVNGNTYTFPLGDMLAGDNRKFSITTKTSCSAWNGSTHCVSAHIYPDTTCIAPPTGWDKSETKVSGACNNDSLVCFTIKNRSAAGSGNMGGASQWRLYSNDTLIAQGTYQLAGQDSIIKCFPASGKTYRLEADQNQPHPGNRKPRAFVEACGNPFNPGFINTAPQDDEDLFIETFCMEVTGPVDPNDKRVLPAGITSNHYITKDDELEYMIRFQNTGNDTAFKVIITDTIDTDVLDIATLTSGTSSHNYTFNIYGQGIAEWTFNNIMLPDSNVDEPGSNGFVQFKIKQLPGNIDGTRIDNRAAIYFDFNAPVITNYAHSEVNEGAMPQALLEATIQVLKHAKCKGNTDGLVQVNVTGGLPPYAYAWSNGDTLAVADNLAAGTHRVTVTDAAASTMVDSVTITEPPLLVNSITATHPLCFGDSTGTAISVATGGIPPYTIVWDNGARTFAINALAAGLYAAVVLDSNQCVALDSITIAQPPQLVVTVAKTDATCFGVADGSARTAVSGGTPPYSVTWPAGAAGASDSITGLFAGAYVVSAADTYGCVATDSFTINQPAEITYTTSITDITCHGDEDGAIFISGNAGLQYLWSTGEVLPTRNNLAGGVYVVTVTDPSGCTKVDSIAVVEPDSLVIALTHEDVLCFGDSNGTATALATGGIGHYSYEWSNGEITNPATYLHAAVHTITVEDGNGCSAIAGVTITQRALLTVAATVELHPICYGDPLGIISTDVQGGTAPYDFMWSTGSTDTTVRFLVAGEYTVTITDAHNCVAVDSATVQEGILVNTGSITGADTADIKLPATYTATNPSTFILWEVTNGTITLGQGTATIVVDWDTAGQGTVKVTVYEDECAGSVARTITLINATGIEDVLLNQFELYPNPTGGSVTIKHDNSVLQGDAIVKGYNAVSKEVLRKKVEAAALRNGVEIDLSAFDAGVFYICVKAGNNMRMLKVVKY